MIVSIPLWLVLIYIGFTVITGFMGFVTGYQLADKVWLEFYMEKTKNDNERDIAGY
jgi:hypothetical protein